MEEKLDRLDLEGVGLDLVKVVVVWIGCRRNCVERVCIRVCVSL